MIISDKQAEIAAQNVKFAFEEDIQAQAMKSFDSDEELIEEHLKVVEPESQTPVKMETQTATTYFPITIALPNGGTQQPAAKVTTEEDKIRNAKIIGGILLFCFVAFLAYSAHKNK